MIVIKGKNVSDVTPAEFIFKTERDHSRLTAMTGLVEYCRVEDLHITAMTVDEDNELYSCCIDGCDYMLEFTVVDDDIDQMISSTYL